MPSKSLSRTIYSNNTFVHKLQKNRRSVQIIMKHIDDLFLIIDEPRFGHNLYITRYIYNVFIVLNL